MNKKTKTIKIPHPGKETKAFLRSQGSARFRICLRGWGISYFMGGLGK
jgi:hypothetical protein